MYPVRLSENNYADSALFQHTIHKRDITSNTINQQNVVYVFPAYGRQFLFELSFTKDFLSPGDIIVEKREANYTWVEHGFEERLDNCFYTGKVNNDTFSRAVFSLCDGMVSL